MTIGDDRSDTSALGGSEWHRDGWNGRGYWPVGAENRRLCRTAGLYRGYRPTRIPVMPCAGHRWTTRAGDRYLCGVFDIFCLDKRASSATAFSLGRLSAQRAMESETRRSERWSERLERQARQRECNRARPRQKRTRTRI